MSNGASNFEHGGDDLSNLSSFVPAMNPSTSHSTPTPTPSYNAEMAAANGAQANSGSTSGREGSYVPQFSAATEMILRRMRGEPTGEFDPSSSPNVDGWEEAKAKVMMGMKTSMNMDMGPMPQNTGRRGSAQRAAAASRAAASRAASRRASSTPGPAPGPASSASTPVPSASTSVPKAPGRSTPTNRSTPTSAARSTRGGRGSATRGGGRGGRAGGKRKRQAKEESESAEESDSMSKLGDDSSDDDGDSITNMPSMTSSGRQIQKPKNFNPVAIEGPPRKRAAAPKKIQEQALCRRCGRGHSPQSNMIVFCDGCNMGWHQMCHDPVVSDEVVKDESSEWFCAECTAQREKKSKPSKTEPVQTQPAQGGELGGSVGGGQGQAAAQGQQAFIEQQQPRMESSGGVSGIGKTMEEKRAYLSVLPHAQLVALLLHATTIHPDLPIFPPTPQHVLASQAVNPAVFYPHAILPSQQQYMGGGGNQAINPRLPSQHTDRRTNVYPQQPFPPSAASGLFSRAEANPTAPINFIRKIPGSNGNGNGVVMASVENPANNTFVQGNYGQQAIYPFPPSFQQQQQQQQPQNQAFRPNPNPGAAGYINPSPAHLGHNPNHNGFINTPNAPPNTEIKQTIEGPDEGDSSRESTPASPPYPRPGNGLMRKLPPDDQDLEWLEDVGDYEAFSHVVYDSQGRGERIEEDGVPVVVGNALGGLGVGASGVLGMGVSVGMGGVA